jgi:iron complex outermembrane receptor protein
VHETKNIDYSSIDTIGLFVDVNHLRDQKTFDEWLPKVGLNFQLSEDMLFYGSVARGYKSGGWNADFITTLEHFQFNPEYALNYELGLKSTLLDDRITFNASAFITKVNDFQVFQFIPTQTEGAVLSLTNAGKATTQGLEVDIKAALSDSLTLTLNSAVTEAKFDDFKNGGGLGLDYDNNYLPYAPKHAYYLALDYSKPLFTQMEMYAHIDYSYTGDYFSNPNNSLNNSIASYYVTNARLGVNISTEWDVSLWVKNLTDETNLRQSSVSFMGVWRGLYNPPRTYGLELKYHFN